MPSPRLDAECEGLTEAFVAMVLHSLVPHRTVIAGFFSLAFLSCGEDARTTGGSGSTHVVELSLVEGDWPEDETTLVARFEPPSLRAHAEAPSGGSEYPLGDGWTSLQPGVTVVDVPSEDEDEPAHTIRLPESGESTRINVPIDQPAGSFDLIRIEFSTTNFSRVCAFVQSKKGIEVRTEYAERDPMPEPTVVELDARMFAAWDKPIPTLQLFYQVVGGRNHIYSVELLRRPVSASIPRGDATARQVALKADSRPCRGLLPGMRLAGAWDARALPGEFALEVDVASAPGTPESAVGRAHVRVLGSEGVVAETASKLTDGWKTVSLDLGDDPGSGERRVEITTDAQRGALIGQPRVRDPRGSEDPAPRTVVLITSDTHRADFVGYAPAGARVRTPTIDALAARGTRFDDATSVSSITNPSHASILTGKRMRDTGVLGNLVLLSDRAELVAERFRAAGFRTFASVSARHLMPSRSGFGQGFERFSGPSWVMARDGGEAVGDALSMLDAAEGDDVFLWLHLFDVHAPYRVHDELLTQYYEGDPYSEKLAALKPEMAAAWDRKIRDSQYILALYKNEVTYLDGLLDRFLSSSERVREGWLALTADHGESHGEQGIYWKHAAIYPSTVRVPLILAGPTIPAGQVIERPVENRDIAQTLLKLAGEDDEAFPGGDLLDSKRAPEPHFTVAPNGTAGGIIADGWYLILHLKRGGWGNPVQPNYHAAELYDLANDPMCRRNVIGEHEDRASRLRSSLVAHLSAMPEGGYLVGEITEDAEAKADVAALGYATNAASKIDGALMDADCPCEECRRHR